MCCDVMSHTTALLFLLLLFLLIIIIIVIIVHPRLAERSYMSSSVSVLVQQHQHRRLAMQETLHYNLIYPSTCLVPVAVSELFSQLISTCIPCQPLATENRIHFQYVGAEQGNTRTGSVKKKVMCL